MMMPVDINQWRATIGCFRVVTHNRSPMSKNLKPLSRFLQIFKLYWFCYSFIAIAVIAIPLTLTMQFFAVHSVATQSCFLPLLARVHHFAEMVLYITVELVKRIPLGFIVIIRYKYFHSKYAFFHIACLAFYALHIKWLVLRIILLCGDIETNPGPETFDFCSWNLNSITAYDFLRVSLIEAYNSVYNYDMIGVVETHLDSTIEESRLALDGYTCIQSNHPHNVKRSGVGLYIKESLASQNRSDLVTLPECIVC